MTGPEHYRQAEQLLEEATGPADHGVASVQAHIALAQAHATLALAAVSAAAVIMAADATASYDGPGAGRVTAGQVAGWKEVIR